MSTTETKFMTIDEFLALPDGENFERNLINGELFEQPMTLRSEEHGEVQMEIGRLILNWMDTQPAPRGQCIGGESAVKLGESTLVGVDAAYLAFQDVEPSSDKRRHARGRLILAVEVLSPSDRTKDTDAKVAAYLEAGTPHVWVANPWSETITVTRPGQTPQVYTLGQEITCEPDMPGFAADVSKIFGHHPNKA